MISRKLVLQRVVKMMILENNSKPFMENGEPIISRKELDSDHEPFSKNG